MMMKPWKQRSSIVNSESCIASCKKYDICKNYLLTDNKFKCKVTGRFYNVRDNLSCNWCNTIYLIFCKNYEDQYIRAAIDFKARFSTHKSDIRSKKERCGTARHFNTKCSVVQIPPMFLQVQLIESVLSDLDLENKLWEREESGNASYLPTHMAWTVSLIYMLVKEKDVEKNVILLFGVSIYLCTLNNIMLRSYCVLMSFWWLIY